MDGKAKTNNSKIRLAAYIKTIIDKFKKNKKWSPETTIKNGTK